MVPTGSVPAQDLIVYMYSMPEVSQYRRPSTPHMTKPSCVATIKIDHSFRIMAPKLSEFVVRIPLGHVPSHSSSLQWWSSLCPTGACAWWSSFGNKYSYPQYAAKATVAIPKPGKLPLNRFHLEKGPVYLHCSLEGERRQFRSKK